MPETVDVVKQEEKNYGPNKPSSERAIKEAQEKGYDVVLPEANQLFIDIDNEESLAIFDAHRDIVDKHIGVATVIQRPSKSGTAGKFHIVVTLDRNITELERLILQATLGSDRKRDLLGFIQFLNDGPHPTLFLENKEQKVLPPAPEPKLLPAADHGILTDEDIPF